MAINFVTGLPRQGKTLYTLWHVKDRADKEKRPVYTCNLTGVNVPGWLQIDHPDKWMDCPDGSIIIVDELQDFWGKANSSQKVPTPILELSKHGKRGIEFYFITQEPNLVHSTPRDLCENHYYVVRAFGTESAMVYKFRRMQLHPDKVSKKDCEQIPFKYPKNVYQWYKSADTHNVKRVIPWKLYAIPIAAVMAIGALFLGAKLAQGTLEKVKQSASKANPVPGGDLQLPSVRGQVAGVRSGGVDDYFSAYEPRIRGLPNSAPRYDGLTAPTVAPYPAACVKMADQCRCYTQQATPLDSSKELCLQIVKHGYFVDWQLNTGNSDQQQERSFTRHVPNQS